MPEKENHTCFSISRRKEILELTGLKFTIDAGDYEEDMNLGLKPHQLAKFLSLKSQGNRGQHSNALVISADTFIVLRTGCWESPIQRRRQKECSPPQRQGAFSHYRLTIIDTNTKKKLSGS